MSPKKYFKALNSKDEEKAGFDVVGFDVTGFLVFLVVVGKNVSVIVTF